MPALGSLLSFLEQLSGKSNPRPNQNGGVWGDGGVRGLYGKLYYVFALFLPGRNARRLIGEHNKVFVLFYQNKNIWEGSLTALEVDIT